MQNQNFFVLYEDERIAVNPSLLYDSSKKFHELVDNAQSINSIYLKINYDKFTVRNVNNFLKLCQNEPTDVQNSELKEICKIAKMFQASKIYKAGIDFIRQNVDPNFDIPDGQFDETDSKQYLQLEIYDSPSIHHADLNELEFDDSSDVTETDTGTEAKTETEIETQKVNEENQILPTTQKMNHRTICYQITSDNPFMKCRRFYLSKDNQIIYMAKQNHDEIYIGEGNDFHISENRAKNTARICRKRDGFNIVTTDEQEFKIKYVKYGNGYSIEVSFDHDGTKLDWRPKRPKRFTSFNGGYGRNPVYSKKNTILQNPSNRPTFIVRKMSDKIYEAECNPNVNPIIVFAIALSQIIGPF